VSTLAESPSIPTAKDLAPVPRGERRRWTYFVLPIYSSAVFLYLLVPISVMVLYSFNQSHSALPQLTFKWQGATTQWYREWNGIPGLGEAFFLSIKLALLSTFVSAVLGTLLALALVRYRFRGKRVSEQVLFTNIAAPEIVLGASLLGFFITLNVDRGFSTLLIAHVMFCVAYVTITVRSRSQPSSARTFRTSALVVSLWMNAGLSGAQISTYRSTGISYWACSGSMPPKASSIIPRACSTSARVLGRGLNTKI
jgi:spermidine/putrescine transport system permease protein